MQARFASAVLLGFVLIAVAACSGSDGLSEAEEEALQERVEQAELEAAEAERRRLAEEAARKKAEQEAADAETEAAEAEDRADDAEDEITEAQEAQQAAQAARQAAERARQAAEEQRRAAEERLGQSAEERQSAGFGTSAGTLVVTPRRVDATPTADTEIVISTPDFGPVDAAADAAWRATAAITESDGTYRDTVRVFSDVGPHVEVPFKDSTYNAGRRVVNAEGVIIGSVPIRGARTDVMGTGMQATQFPDTSAPARSFDLIDQGFATELQRDAAIAACAEDQVNCVTDIQALGTGGLRDTTMWPLRYGVEVTGANLLGAGGRFLCESSSRNTACTVQNRGGDQLFFTGPWKFTPASATENVDVPDANYMWFGWWARQQIATKEWSYAVGHGPAGSRVSSVSAVSGTATYAGSAIGRFAIDDPLDDTDLVGSFTAVAELNADFDENTLSGTVSTFMLTGEGATDFPDQGNTSDERWTVHLRKGSISGGSASGTSAWSIGDPETTDNVDEGGAWSGNFYSDLPANQRAGVVPYGFAGTFTAEHTGAANMIGAFGAHR